MIAMVITTIVFAQEVEPFDNSAESEEKPNAKDEKHYEKELEADKKEQKKLKEHPPRDEKDVEYKKKKKIVTVGDSITYGICTSNRNSTSWPAVLGKLSGLDIINHGKSGKFMRKKAGQPYRDESVYDYTLKLHPDLIIMMLGTNDARPMNWDEEDYKKDLIEMVEEFQNMASKPKVYVMIPPAMYQKFKEIEPMIVNTKLPRAVRDAHAQMTNVTLINTRDALGGLNLEHNSWFCNDCKPMLYCDGCHPNDGGHEILGSHVHKILVKNGDLP